MLRKNRLLLHILLTLLVAATIVVLLLLPGIIGPATAPLVAVVTLVVIFMITDPVLGSVSKWLKNLGFTDTMHDTARRRHTSISWWHVAANKAWASTTAGFSCAVYRVTCYVRGARVDASARTTGLEVRRHATIPGAFTDYAASG